MNGVGKFSHRAFRLGAVAALPFLLALPVSAQDLSSCKGSEFKRFIGKPVKAMQKLRTANVRYVCTQCPMTMDYREDRLTVTFFRRSGRIKEMRCV